MSLLWAIPFIGILLSIAVCPLVFPRTWHHHYGKISLFWGLLFIILLTIFYGFDVSLYYALEVYLLEFLPFITLLLALFTVSGGIYLRGSLTGTPLLNSGILLLGTFLASWMGTTGAAMIMIRPLIRANAWRTSKTHIIVFFIFLVANIGGSLTPLGDPPLFLGYLKGVSFFWTTRFLLSKMLTAVAILITTFFIIDTIYYNKEKHKPGKKAILDKLSIEGKGNFILLAAIIGAVIFSSFNLGTAFTIHHASMPLASLIQILLLLFITLISVKMTKKEIRDGNEFSWEPIREVAKLFATIFVTMVAPIAMLKAGAEGPLGMIIKSVIDSNGNFINSNFFWATGALSSFLDNAPTYVIFFETAGGNASQLMTAYSDTLIAISCGAVFMGANTYIGNAPNFMVKSIAEERGIKMPSFFGYILKYSLPILIPVFIIITLIFFL
jgi:Na+/H+ antiporter NhaD/arsenite permease-like protein